MTLIEILKALHSVAFVECSDGCLWYDAVCNPANVFRFRIPLTDVVGATFPAVEYENPRYYQRWIRKELELQKSEAEVIEQARAEHEASIAFGKAVVLDDEAK